MFDQYSEEALKLIDIARNEAHDRGNDYIGTEHILLAVLKDANGLTVRILEKMGIMINEVLMEVARRNPSRQDILKLEKLPFTLRAKAVFDLAAQEAHSLGNNYVQIEHLMLALIREENGSAGKILRFFGANLQDGRILTKYSKPVE